MNRTIPNRGTFHIFMSLLAILSLFTGSGFNARATALTFSAPANCAAATDVQAGGGGQLFAYTWGGATTINGVSFTPTTSFGAVGANLVLSNFTGSAAAAFVGALPPFTSLSASYSNLV